MTTNNMDADEKMPIDRKLCLSITEASKYSGIGINTIQNLVKQDDCPFVLNVGSKRMVKRKEFEVFLSQQNKI